MDEWVDNTIEFAPPQICCPRIWSAVGEAECRGWTIAQVFVAEREKCVTEFMGECRRFTYRLSIGDGQVDGRS
jgi:hypothetical protein